MKLNILHNLDNSHYGGIQEMILTLHKHSRHRIDFWAADGTMAPEMRAAGMTLLPGGPERWEDYGVLVMHGVGGWSCNEGFDYAHSKGLKTVEVMHSNARSLTDPGKVDAFVGLSPLVTDINHHMPNRHVIYGPVDTYHFYHGDNARYIGRLSRLVEDKNPRPFLELARRFPQEEFVIAGGRNVASGESAAYYDMIVNSKPPNVAMANYVRDLPEFYSHLKLYVYHTKDECCAMSVNMAMAAGIPVICQDLAPLRETTGGNAIFCSTEDDFVNAISRFLLDPDSFAPMVEAGRRWSDSHAGLEATVGAWDELVEYLVQ